MKQGLVEYVLVSAFLALAAAGAIAIFGDELRGALGVDLPAAPAAAPAPAPAPPAPPSTRPTARPAAPSPGRPAAPAARVP